MRFDELPEMLADNRAEGEYGRRDLGDDTDAPIRIPLKIDEGIVVHSITNTSHIAKARIIGAKAGDYVLITEPTVRINERVAAVLDKDFLCSYFCDGNLYIFHSRCRRYMTDDVMCIEYPREVEVRQIRKDRRIKVNIETKLVVSDTAQSFLVDLADISRGGCRVILNQRRVPMTKGTNLSLAFSLPNEAFISSLQAEVVRIDLIKDSVATEIGLKFTGPQSELSKVENFCDFCMFFALE
jgi:c-di-GMP-binding flagellar brake protein YcgR